jgi:SMC interacting uncharacterized protein involved in chromosome segregation
MARITINEAAKQGFKSRSQINKDVRSGKLPHTMERDTKVVDVSDLIKLYGEPGGGPTEIPTTAVKAEAERSAEKTQEELARIQVELREARDTIRDKESEAAKERDRLMSMLEEGQKQLADLRERGDKDQKRQDEEVTRLRKELDEARADLKAEQNKSIFKRIFGG